MEDKIKQIADYYGFTSQADMLTEEAAEFTVALNKLRRGHADAYEHIKIIEEKVERQLGRIREEKGE